MSYKFNPFTGNFDIAGVNPAGDTMTGDLIFPINGFVMTDSNSVQWRVTINTDGSLQTTVIVSGTGSPMGLLLALTYAA